MAAFGNLNRIDLRPRLRALLPDSFADIAAVQPGGGMARTGDWFIRSCGIANDRNRRPLTACFGTLVV